MKILGEDILKKILSNFDFDGKLFFEKPLKYEPDCYLYFFVDENRDKYVLVCRDLVQDDFEAEKRIFKKELGIQIVGRIKTKTRAFWLEMTDLDDFRYIFSLTKYIQV